MRELADVRHVGVAALWGVGAGCAAWLLVASLGQGLELASQDLRMAWQDPPPRSEDPRVVLVTISDATYRELAEPRVFWGGYLARALERLSARGARAIGIDLIQAVPVDRYAPELDEALAGALMTTPGVVLIYQRVRLPDGSGMTLRPHDQLVTALVLGGGTLGNNHLWPDEDRVVRRWRLAGRVGSELEQSLPLALVSAATGEAVALDAEGELLLGGRQLESVAGGEIRIRFRGPPGSYPEIPFEALVAEEGPELSPALDDLLDGAIVLIGSVSLADQDVHAVPTGDERLRGWMPGVELHANVIDTVLADDGLRSAPQAGVVLVAGVGVLLVAALFAWLSFWPSLLAWLGLELAVSIAVFAAAGHRLLLPWVAPAVALVVVFAGSWSYRGWASARQKREIRGLFERYVPKAVVETLIAHPELARLDGERREVTVLFSDIRNFTSMSETMDAGELSRLLNHYLTRMTRILLGHGATVDKYMGDGIMAIFGAPLAMADGPEQAVRCGLEMVEALEELRVEWTREGVAGAESFDIGIGIHTGEAFVGNVGAPERMEYTAIGDTVNLASRLEGANKELGTRLLVSDRTHELLPPIAVTDRVQELAVKGRRQRVVAYAVRGWSHRLQGEEA